MVEQKAEAPTSEQAGQVNRDEKGRFLRGQSGNPDGKGGFGDNPENINYDGRTKNRESFTHWMGVFKDMSVAEFLAWERKKPEEEIPVAAAIAWRMVFNSRTDLQHFKEVADRTEGKAPQTLVHEGGFFSTDKLLVEVVDAQEDKPAQD